MPSRNTFEILLLIARPAAGKSEIIDYLKRVPESQRIERFHIGRFQEIDDFPMLWTWIEEDMLLEKMGHPRLNTDADGYFLHQYQWDLLIERIGSEYQKKLRDIPDYSQLYTTIVEFSRGREHGGYRSAFSHLSPLMLPRLAVMYIDVTWEESLRKNRRRFNPEKPDSVLEHGMTDAKLARLYRHVDWEEISSRDPQFLDIQGAQVPYAIFDNADDVTTARGPELGQRLEETLGSLWELYRSKQS
jgi:hypothetical protein